MIVTNRPWFQKTHRGWGPVLPPPSGSWLTSWPNKHQQILRPEKSNSWKSTRSQVFLNKRIRPLEPSSNAFSFAWFQDMPKGVYPRNPLKWPANRNRTMNVELLPPKRTRESPRRWHVLRCHPTLYPAMHYAFFAFDSSYEKPLYHIVAYDPNTHEATVECPHKMRPSHLLRLWDAKQHEAKALKQRVEQSD